MRDSFNIDDGMLAEKQKESHVTDVKRRSNSTLTRRDPDRKT